MDNEIVKSCQRLVVDGWLPLRRLSFLLGYKNPTGIYGRRGSPNEIPAVKVGGQYRVYFDDVIHALENPVRTVNQDDVKPILSLIHRMMKDKQKE